MASEIEIPKEIRPFMLEGAEETTLGNKNGAKKQFRYGLSKARDQTFVLMDASWVH